MKKIQYYMSDSQLLKTQNELNGIIDIMKSNMNKVIMDSKGGSGVVPYLPLAEVQRRPAKEVQQ